MMKDQGARKLLLEIFDEAEARLVRDGVCAPSEASDYLARQLVRQCGSLSSYSTVFLESDEYSGMEIFLSKLVLGRNKAAFNRNPRRYAEYLRDNAATLFPSFLEVLTMELVRELSQFRTADEIAQSGTVLLAVATLDGALIEVRRELRRRGIVGIRTLVVDDILSKRLPRFRRQARLLQGD